MDLKKEEIMKTFECIAHSGNTGKEIVIMVRAGDSSKARMDALNTLPMVCSIMLDRNTQPIQGNTISCACKARVPISMTSSPSRNTEISQGAAK